jgi:hypothetical protein
VDWCSRRYDSGGRVGENLVGQIEDRLRNDGDLYLIVSGRTDRVVTEIYGAVLVTSDIDYTDSHS